MTVGFGGAGQEPPARAMLAWWGELWGQLQLDEGTVTSHTKLFWENASVPQSSLGREAAPSTYCACALGS